MIREYQTKDLDSVMSLWLSGNQQAHHFIDPQFYQNNYEFVKMLMPLRRFSYKILMVLEDL